MEKPRSRVHFRKDSQFDMGLLVLGRTVIPVWIIVSTLAILVAVFLIGGGFEAGFTNGESTILLMAGGVVALAIIAALIVWGLITLFLNMKRDIKKATRRVHGEKD